ncbi:MAG: DUF6785 family protein [Planctomycetota bacterium]
MPVVGLILGLVLALWISVFTLFNDAYLEQPLMTGNLMPTSVYGPAVLMVLVACGFSVRGLTRRQIFGRRDLVAMVLIASAACAWPGTNYLRTFVGSTGNVANLAKTQDQWRDADVMKHLPSGVLLADGHDTPGVTDGLTLGAENPDDYDPANVPWGAWWPVLRLWGGVALLLGLAGVCLGLIVHPQWARYEKLPYPLVRFVEELSRPGEPNPERGDPGRRPAILRNKLFWLGLGGVALIHLLNGLWAWNIHIVRIPLEYDFTPLKALFPHASRAPGNDEQFQPAIYFSVIAFVFFIRGDVSFSVGFSNFLWLMLGAAFLSRGQTLGNNPLETDSGTLLRAGAYLGFAGMILYLGRRYYLSVAAGAIGLNRSAEFRGSAWAARAMTLCLAGAVWLLAAYAGLDWRLGVVAVLLVLIIVLIMARLSAETGMFYLEPNWMPLVVVSALLGFEGLGPTTFLVVALFSTIIAGAPREPLMGYVTNGLQLAERVGGRKKLGGVGLGMAGVAVVTLGLAVLATLVLSHTRGLSAKDPWGTRWHAALPFDALARRLSDAVARGDIGGVTSAANAGHFAAATPDIGALGWLALGAALVVGCAFARLRLAWWPIHPVLFLVLGSSPAIRVGWSFLIGWAIRQLIVRLGGVKAFHAALPLAVGAIAGELLAALGWQLCGSIYYFATGLGPGQYFILPN